MRSPAPIDRLSFALRAIISDEIERQLAPFRPVLDALARIGGAPAPEPEPGPMLEPEPEPGEPADPSPASPPFQATLPPGTTWRRPRRPAPIPLGADQARAAAFAPGQRVRFREGAEERVGEVVRVNVHSGIVTIRREPDLRRVLRPATLVDVI